MHRNNSNLSHALEVGLAAGLLGTGVMVALRVFDQKYAPPTIPRMKQDPGEFMVKTFEKVTTQMPVSVRKSAALAMRLGYGSLMGCIYGLCRGKIRRRSALAEGAALGTAVYAAGYLGWLPALHFSKPAWKQSFPQVAGELSRHLAYGVATAAAYKLIDTLV